MQKKSLEISCYVAGAGAFGVFFRWLQDQMAFDEAGLAERSVFNYLVPLVILASALLFNRFIERARGEKLYIPMEFCQALRNEGKLFTIARWTCGLVMALGGVVLIATSETDKDAELLLALAFGLRTGRALRWVAGVNLATQLGLNLALEVFTYCNGALAGVMALLALPVYLAAEVAVTLVELRIYRRKLTGERGLSGRRITAYTWTANLCSFLAGVLLSFQLPTLF